MSVYKVGYIIGSLASVPSTVFWQKRLSELPEELEFSEIEIKIYRYTTMNMILTIRPSRAFKQAIAEVDAVLFVTPEYNRAIPAPLKMPLIGPASLWAELLHGETPRYHWHISR